MSDVVDEEVSEYLIQQVVVQKVLVDGEYRFRVAVAMDMDVCEVMGMLETAKMYIMMGAEGDDD